MKRSGPLKRTDTLKRYHALTRGPWKRPARTPETRPALAITAFVDPPQIQPPRPKRRGVNPKLRQFVIERDRGCLAARVFTHSCGGRIDPHHVWRQGRGGPDEDWNLIAVCRVAHNWIHDHPADAIRLGLLSSSSLGEFGSRQAQHRRERRGA